MTISPLPTAATLRHGKIASLLGMMLGAREDLLEVVVEAKASDDHLAFGYSSWPAYVAGEFGQMLADLNREDRRLFALALAETGMSSRALAPVLGISDRQVRRDIGQVGHDVPPADEGPPLAPYCPTNVTGLDGKSYQRAARKPARRPSLPDGTWNACRELQKAVERLDRLVSDDRFPQHRDAIHRQHAADLARTAKALWAVRAKIGTATVLDGEVVE